MMPFTVLIVDDEAAILRLLSTALHQAYPRWDTLTARSVPRAWLQLNSQLRFDLVLVDGQIGSERGTDLIRAAQRLAHPPPFLGMSGDPGALDDLVVAGCLCAIAKPFSLEALYTAVEHTLHRAKHIEEKSYVATDADAGLGADGASSAVRLRPGAPAGTYHDVA